jgi:hypothetical protein
MTKKEFFAITELLVAEHDDYIVGIENIKNLKPGKVTLSLFAKNLKGHKRAIFQEFVEKTFKIKLEITEWNLMFESIKKDCNDQEKEIVEHLINKDLTIIKNHYSFISNFKIKLKW